MTMDVEWWASIAGIASLLLLLIPPVRRFIKQIFRAIAAWVDDGDSKNMQENIDRLEDMLADFQKDLNSVNDLRKVMSSIIAEATIGLNNRITLAADEISRLDMQITEGNPEPKGKKKQLGRAKRNGILEAEHDQGSRQIEKHVRELELIAGNEGALRGLSEGEGDRGTLELARKIQESEHGESNIAEYLQSLERRLADVEKREDDED